MYFWLSCAKYRSPSSLAWLIASLYYAKLARTTAGGRATRGSESSTQLGRWQTEEASAIGAQRQEPRVDPNSAEAKRRCGSTVSVEKTALGGQRRSGHGVLGSGLCQTSWKTRWFRVQSDDGKGTSAISDRREIPGLHGSRIKTWGNRRGMSRGHAPCGCM